jgi:hypothetical protein
MVRWHCEFHSAAEPTMPTRIRISMLCCALLANLAVGQEQNPGGESTTVARWVVEVIGYAGRVDENLGEFPTYEAAAAREKRWSDEHPKDLRLTRSREIKVSAEARDFVKAAEDAKEAYSRLKEAKEAVDKAKEFLEKGLTAAERKAGDTLKEYRDAVKKAYDNVIKAKENLASMTGRVREKQFQEINRLIDSYNRANNGLSGSPARPGVPAGNLLPRIAPLKPEELRGKLSPDGPEAKYTVWVFKAEAGQWVKHEDRTFSTDDAEAARGYMNQVKRVPGWTATSNLPKPQAASLVGRRGRGTFMDGVTPFSVEFRAGGVGLFKSADESFPGTWSVEGNSITMKAGASTFTGAIEGNRLSGRVSRTNASSVVDGGRLVDRGGPWDLTLDP